ncbi:TRAP transporter large permease subunit [Pseudomonas sp. MDMC216]|jgi:tripartite ATP-independent transporter DctM subunit|uniref:TRAP transporter large permease protein n=1 Tax=Ectopseudomonas chengduensis TaxID=489632 RepID=A0A1G6IMK2_9GAMM|nr:MULTISPECIES: TRAP transporter large permease subunit [Pseudomonas]MDP3366569.1 TRAP transporter large permease subunit [Pseudomonas sp.]KQO33557.1 C4-dicarboxylate ABC transporter [Pseudomonas sp. Leaf83]MBP3059876.1 TRAP transporter large permease subunit [Pseudomonas chengduensis]MDH0956457.1 TRAP transporter large permease subunit [Pseudomonas chengduensis]MDH1534453.1 TRAP transporter large permease subunit [Pseudomonas chengduensis]
MSPNEWLAILMVLAFFSMMMVGVPVAISLAVSGFAAGLIGFGPMLFSLLPARMFGVVSNYTLLAIPLFTFMGVMLEKSRVAEDMLETVGQAMGGLNGGMGLAIVLVGVLLGASTGIVGATVVTIGLLTLPVLLRRGYKPSVACGTICASGTLGQIIPPSLVLILLADILGESVGSIFAAAFIPSLMLAGVYIVYMLLLGWLRPQWVPAIPAEERALISRKQLWQNIAKSVLPPLLLVVCVLGSIIGGLAAPTEAASIGALGALVIAGCARRLNRDTLKQTLHGTLSISAMIFLILLCSQPFSLAFRGLGGEALVHDLFSLLPGGELGAILFLMVLLFVLGFFLEWIEISYIALPMFLPVFMGYGTDMVWLAILVALNLQMSFLTPPFGWALFFLKGVAPPGISTKDIYIGALPFVALQMLAVALVFAFPTLATWLPKAIGW